MKQLTISQLHNLRLCIYHNSELLFQEAKLLLQHQHYARAYLLAHFTTEELGKLPLIVGVVAKLLGGEVVNWKEVLESFNSHKLKVESDDLHLYVFGSEAACLHDIDLEWIKNARDMSAHRVSLKNASTYVDVRGQKVTCPSQMIDEQCATRMLERAERSLAAHWYAEWLYNPVVVEEERSAPMSTNSTPNGSSFSPRALAAAARARRATTSPSMRRDPGGNDSTV
jgi:AbiV family abortive infection protein